VKQKKIMMTVISGVKTETETENVRFYPSF